MLIHYFKKFKALKKSTRSIIIFGFVLLLFLIGFLSKHHHPIKPPALPAIAVSLTPVTTANIPLTATSVGSLFAEQATDISPKMGGYVSNILFKEGDFVSQGALLIQLDDRKEQNDLAAAKVDAELSQRQYDHDALAYKKGLILQDTLYNSKVTNEKNEALVKEEKTAVDNMALIAPFSGYVGEKKVNLGDYVSPGQKLVSLVDQQHLQVHYVLPAKFSPQISLNQRVTLTTDTLPGKSFIALVTFISPVIDPDSQTIAVHASLNNPGNLKPGQFVNVTHQLSIISNALLIPENCLIASMNGYHVFTIKNNHAVATKVSIGEHVGNTVQITQGLSAKDSVVSLGQDQLKDGDLVSIIQHPQKS